jgi:L-seryl-tRNA(Ser) seleniumtransferase
MRVGTKRPGKALLQLEAAFRALPRAVIGYIRNDAYHLDLRCLEAGEEARFVTQLTGLDLTP